MSRHRRSQDFVWGAHFYFSSPKSWPFLVKLTFFSCRPQSTRYIKHYTYKQPLPLSKFHPISSENWTLALPLGCTLYLGVHLQLSPVNLAKLFFLNPGCTCTQCTPNYVYYATRWTVKRATFPAFIILLRSLAQIRTLKRSSFETKKDIWERK